ncbi:MAG: hypothetical protein HY699_15000 [Deltaproteobacteria bacterium]|nr:hypothetical protein [Deltaproteobacteria bacterium]
MEPPAPRLGSVAHSGSAWYKWSMLAAVTINEIEKIFTVIERHGLSREAVIIPLRPASPGVVKRLANGKFEIVVDGEVPIDDWLTVLEAKLCALLPGS